MDCEETWRGIWVGCCGSMQVERSLCMCLRLCFEWGKKGYKRGYGMGVGWVHMCGNKERRMGGKLVYTSPAQTAFCMASDR